MKWKPSQSAAESARALLPKLAEQYFEAGRKAAAGYKKPKALHRFRIATKRFRYTLELFRPVYGPSLDRRLKVLRGLQESLGKVSDYQTIRKLLSDGHALESKLQKGIKKNSREFGRRWKALDSNSQLKRWKAYLARTNSGSHARVAPRRKTGGRSSN